MTSDIAGKIVLLAGRRDAHLEAAGAALLAQRAAIVLGDDLGEGRRVIARQPRIDIAVINAGWRHTADFMSLTNADWEEAIAENFEAPVFIAQAVARKMIDQQQGGRILFLAGVDGMMPFSGRAATGTTLTMIWAVARMAAIDLAPHGITVNVIAPGWAAQGELSLLPPDVQAHVLAGIPVGRPAASSDIGHAVLMLASPDAGYLTGVILPVDGGYILSRSEGRSMFEP
jgi:2-dehydro-3-deoxy-D-gluconate 5-dehydrogenase